mmetsp:Transcript_49423/g.105219  ORF Transcript_49423/g.105219 Transcript_49423/m.105219 type:complete len:213 (-) Transcript_49423:353-991(-)|eukprot:CAMPEP_0206514636 /NCGR_PEP_ID=MMETSP0324_2-20121206/62249_1 /ASSEMBLY_ACC=CAM_ASM_000836 /TAXON_ID=2866 /ORGANISM="Crypthecodinium cohnii, Strain Seligo" /LENGTH=212 /DNA_ID=CAMNT_0054007135 /DNA_START=75 /DNA_END=713 /DNA_ORIENTATION=+
MANIERTLYNILGVDEEVTSDELLKAYRARALENHPDKGGDANLFDEIQKAFKILENEQTREIYDDELAKARDRAILVSGGGPSHSTQQAQAPMPRNKTEPTAGSKRQGKLRTGQPGKPQHCADEWKGQKSGSHFLKALCDEAPQEQKIEALFDKYATLPRGKDKKREWLDGVRGEDKQDLKALAKKKEAEMMAKRQGWLNNGPRTRANKYN